MVRFELAQSDNAIVKRRIVAGWNGDGFTLGGNSLRRRAWNFLDTLFQILEYHFESRELVTRLNDVFSQMLLQFRIGNLGQLPLR